MHNHKHYNQKLEKLEKLAIMMDSKFVLPGTSIRFGLDSIIGMIPVLGDTFTFASTAYFYHIAHSFKMPWHLKIRILFNGFIDWLIGLIPLLGDIFDVRWKSNLRNFQLIKRHLKDKTII
jgi:hypothetical protein